MDFILIVEIIGTIAFAISGALAAIEHDLDHYGIIRDVLINEALPVALKDPVYIIVSIAAAIVVILFYKEIKKHRNTLQFFDAIGLAAFTAIGAAAAVRNHIELPFVVLTLAVLTGTGGGTIRDVFVREVPFVFRKEIYAVASIIGALCFLLCYQFFSDTVAIYVTVALTFIIRILSIKFDLHLKQVRK